MEDDLLAPATLQRLQAAAAGAAARAYAPYSNLQVGASLLTTGGEVVSGCNVENASYGLTLCAERAAVCRAVARGLRNFSILLVQTRGGRLLVPCGACLQVLAEFAPELAIVTAVDPPAAAPLSRLLARPFRLDDGPASPGQ